MDEAMLLREYLGKRKPFDEVYSLLNQSTRSPAGNVVNYPITPPGKYVKQEQEKAITGSEQASAEMLKAASDAAQNESLLREAAANRVLEEKSRFGDFVPNVQREKLITEKRNQLSNYPANERNMWAEAIISLGPALLGAMSGSAGMKAALPAQESARKLYEGIRSQNIEDQKKRKDVLFSEIKALESLQNSDLKQYTDRQKMAQAWLKVENDARIGAANSSGKEKEMLLKMADDANKEALKYQMQSPKDVVTAEQKQQDLRNKQNKQNKQSQKLLPGQVQRDKDFAKEWQEFSDSGGFAQVKEQLKTMEEIHKTLLSGKGSGIAGALPKAVRDIVDRENAAIQERLEQIIQRDLRKTLGAQFTEKEGVEFMKRGFNPVQDPKENAKRLKAFMNIVEARAKSILERGKFFEKEGTLSGLETTGSVDKKMKQDEPKSNNKLDDKRQKLRGLLKGG